MRRLVVPVCALLAALGLVAQAAAHARVSPAVSLAGDIQLYSLAVPTEVAGTTTTKVVLVVPVGFSISSFVPTPGWSYHETTGATSSGAISQRVTWTARPGAGAPTGEDALFQFLGEPEGVGSYVFDVAQSYSNGQIVEWTGSETSANPAPTIEAKSSLGGGGTPLLTIVALVVGVLALLVGGAALATRAGARPIA